MNRNWRREDSRSVEQINADSRDSHAQATWAIARRPVPYKDDPKYIEGRADYFYGVDGPIYFNSEGRKYMLGFLEAEAELPDYHNGRESLCAKEHRENTERLGLSNGQTL